MIFNNMVFHHRGARGDIIYALPTIISCGGGTLLLRKRFFYIMKPLLEMQPYIKEVIVDYDCTKPFINLDDWRPLQKRYKRSRNVHHIAFYHLVMLNQHFDLSQTWLFNIPPIEKAKIIICYTDHYHDKKEIDFSLLKDYKDDVLFLGFPNEINYFSSVSGFRPNTYFCKDALEMASIIQGSKLFLSNQTFGFAIAEALKKPRILEVWHENPNCMPNGKDGYTILTKEIIEKYVNT